MAHAKTHHQDSSNKVEALIGSALNGFLANTYVLMAKTQACHWNATGSNFFGLHKLTEIQSDELFAATDLLAERMRALQVQAPAGLGGILSAASLDDASGDDGTEHAVRVLVADNVTMAAAARDLAKQADNAGDPATHDMLVQRIAVHDRSAWLYRSHLE